MRIQLTVYLLSSVLLLACAGLTANAKKPGKWQTLFDGKSTEAWRGYKQTGFPDTGWIVENGALKAVTGGHGDIVTKEKFGDFELELEWRVSPGANSGIFYRATEDNEYIWQSALEFQILDDDKHQDGKEPKTSAGSLYALIATTGKVLEPVGEWNETRIVVSANHVEHWLNGKKVVSYDLGSESLGKLVAASKFATMPAFAKAAEGYVGLQNHGDDVWFRNIRIRRLG
jgi:hypothetical protein